MPFLTIFTAPKPFTKPHISIIQRNAIQSWLHLGDEVEVLLIGEEAGLAEVAKEFHLTHLLEVERNELGTPLVSSIFALARQHSQSPVLAYLNADIIVLPDFVTMVRQVVAQVRDFLIIGQRWNLDIHSELDFTLGWEKRLENEIILRGRLHPPAGSDYFVFPRHLFTDMRPFAIGRAGWDNWTIYHALKQRWATIDATAEIMVIHQDHDYNHLPEGKPHYDLPESRQNLNLGGGMNKMYIVLDANKRLVNGKIVSQPLNLARLVRSLEIQLTTDDQKGPKWALVRQLRKIRRNRNGSI